MKNAFLKTACATAAWALIYAQVIPPAAHAEAPTAPPTLNRTDLTPAALQQASALIEKYVQPIPEPAPTPGEKRAIQSAIELLKSGQGLRQQYAMEQFLNIGPAALGDLRRLAASAPPEQAPDAALSGDAYVATMAPVIIRRIEAAERQPILDELVSLGDEAQVVLLQKLRESPAAVAKAHADVEAATEALIKAAVNTTLDAPAVAGQRKALTEAQAAEKLAEGRQDRLREIARLTGFKAPILPQPVPQVAAPQPPTPPANVLAIQPISPPTGPSGYANTPIDWGLILQAPSDDSDLYLFGGGFDARDDHDFSRRGSDSRREAHHEGGGERHDGGARPDREGRERNDSK